MHSSRRKTAYITTGPGSLPRYPCYRGAFRGGVRVGNAFIITATIERRANHFAIDFGSVSGDKDIALRLYGCVSTNSLTCSSRSKYKWLPEENILVEGVNSAGGRTFKLVVYFREANISIAFDGKHIANYLHKVPFSSISFVESRGNIGVDEIILQEVGSYPEGQIARPANAAHRTYYVQMSEIVPKRLPFKFLITDKKFFTLGNGLGIKGASTPVPTRIIIAVQRGDDVSPQPVKDMQIEIRFTEHHPAKPDEALVALNTYTGTRWTGEVKSLHPSGIRPGVDFTLFIGRGNDGFNIIVNSKYIHSYTYLLKPSLMHTCYIYGDIQLIDVWRVKL